MEKPMSTFTTLLRREWMQHRFAWLLLCTLPPLLILGAVLLTPGVHIQPHEPLAVLGLSTALVTGVLLALAWLVLLFQAPGLARRDLQDRSIEFWLSLPVSHAASLGAMLLMHWIVMPWLALAAGFAASQLVGLAAVAITSGAGAWLDLPWGQLLQAELAGLLRLALGSVLAVLWLSPLLLLLMAASARLKRWGVPAVAGVLLGSALVLQQLYGIGWVGDTLAVLASNAATGIVYAVSGHHLLKIEGGRDALAAMQTLPHWLTRDAGLALRDLASAPFAGAMAFSAACFALLVQLRRRAAG
jgi:hypothetical protein